MARIELDSAQVVAELRALLDELDGAGEVGPAPAPPAPPARNGYWSQRRRLRRGIFLARAAVHGLAYQTGRWDDYVSLQQEYGVLDTMTPAERDLERLTALLRELKYRMRLLAEVERERTREVGVGVLRPAGGPGDDLDWLDHPEPR